MEIPEESVLDLQTIKVRDQCYRETTGDFLDCNALKLGPVKKYSEKSQTKLKSKAYRKAKQYHQRKKYDKIKDSAKENTECATDNEDDADDEITGSGNLAKSPHHQYHRTLDDIDELSSLKDCNSKETDNSQDVTIYNRDKNVATDSSNNVPREDEHHVTQPENVRVCTLSSQEGSEQWQILCEALQNYTCDELRPKLWTFHVIKHVIC